MPVINKEVGATVKEFLAEIINVKHTAARYTFHHTVAGLLFAQGNSVTYQMVTLYFDDRDEQSTGAKTLRTGIGRLIDDMGLVAISPSKFQYVIADAHNVMGYIDITLAETTITVLLALPVEHETTIIDYLNQTYRTTRPQTVKRIDVDRRKGGMTTAEVRVTERGILTNPEARYPYLDKTPEQQWRDFVASGSNVMLLIGSAGTGKSSYIQDMLTAKGWGKDVYLIDQLDVSLCPDLPAHLRGLDGGVVVIEDADMLVGKRSDGNDMMSAILNATSGMATSRTKLIFTTNLPNLKSVDEALLRPGRLFKALEFKPLASGQYNAARQSLGLSDIDELVAPQLTLAEVLNFENYAPIRQSVGYR